MIKDTSTIFTNKPMKVIAALILQPQLLIADEPVSMLDVSMRPENLKTLYSRLVEFFAQSFADKAHE
jgi:ABC-type glutathione transport system ATPase component